MHLTGSVNAGRACLIRDGWCGSGLAALISLQDRENREHVGHVDEEFVITSRRDSP